MTNKQNQAREAPTCDGIHHWKMLTATWLIKPYRKSAVLQTPSKDKYKTSPAFIAEALNGRWSHRAQGYVLSIGQAHLAVALLQLGWNADARLFRNSPAVFRTPEDEKIDAKEMRKRLQLIDRKLQ